MIVRCWFNQYVSINIPNSVLKPAEPDLTVQFWQLTNETYFFDFFSAYIKTK